MRRLALFIVLSFLSRAVLLGVEIVDLDEAAYAVGSWELLRGRRPYTDFADHKPPLVYAYYALPQLFFGRGMSAVRWLTVLLTVPLTALAASAFFRHRREGLVAGVLFLVYGAAFLGHDVLAVNCELLMLLPLGWALVLVREPEAVLCPRSLFGAGFLVGVAVLFKYQAAFAWLALAVAAAAAARGQGRRLGRLGLALSLGAVLPLLAAWAVFAATGGAGDLLYWNITHNLVYTANPVTPAEALERAASYLLPFLLVTAPLWWAWWRSRALFPTRHQSVLVSTLLVLSIPPAFLGLRFYPHYFVQLYLPLALGAAPFASELLRRPLGRGGRALTVHSLVMLVGFSMANAFLYFGTETYAETRPVFRKVADRLRTDPCFPKANLFVWGFAPIFYYYAERPLASRFLMPGPTLVGYVPGSRRTVPGLIRDQHWDWLMSDLRKNQPAYLVDTSPAAIHRWQAFPLGAFPRLARFVEVGYEPLDAVEGVVIYRRRGCVETAPPGR